RCIDGFLPERRVDVSRRNGIHTNAMLSLVYRERFCECGDRAFCRHVCGRKQLAHRADKARHINDVAFSLSKMRQGELAAGEYADEIQVKQIPKLLDRKVVDRFVRRMPSRVVDDAIEAAGFLGGCTNETFNLVWLRDVAPDEHSFMLFAGVEFGSKLIAFLLIPRTEDNRGTRGAECAHASFADAFGAACYDNHLFGIVHTRAKQVDSEAAEPRPSSYSRTL